LGDEREVPGIVEKRLDVRNALERVRAVPVHALKQFGQPFSIDRGGAPESQR
jgi:hypothetical protein